MFNKLAKTNILTHSDIAEKGYIFSFVMILALKSFFFNLLLYFIINDFFNFGNWLKAIWDQSIFFINQLLKIYFIIFII